MFDQDTVLRPAAHQIGAGLHQNPVKPDAADAPGHSTGIMTAESTLQQVPHYNAMLELAAITAHDLRNPLACIICVFETLAELSQQNNVRGLDRFVNRGLRAAGRIEDMTKRLLDTARGIAAPVSFTPCPARDIVMAAVELNAEAARAKSVSLSVTGPNPCIDGDEGLLVEAVDNLISNAIKYAHRGTHVSCVIRQMGGCVFIHISDDGQGFSADDLARFGQKFERLSARPTGNETSTGLGLWSVIKIAEIHKGALYVCSGGLNMGSTLTLRFARVAARHAGNKSA